MSAKVCTWFSTLVRTNFLKMSSQITSNLFAREKNTGKSFSASLGLWVGSEAITPKPKFCQVCVRWSFEGHTVTLSMESLNRFKLSPQIFTADYRSLDKLANRLCLSKHPMNVYCIQAILKQPPWEASVNQHCVHEIFVNLNHFAAPNVELILPGGSF